MKKLFSLLIFCTITTFSFAQTQDNKTWVSLSVAHHEYDGDLGNEILSFNVPNDFGVQLGIHRFLNRSFSSDLSILYGSLDTDSAPLFKKSFVNTHFKLRYNFANGYVFNEHALFQPFLSTGIGLGYFFGENKDIDDQFVLNVPLGGGIAFRLTEGASIQLQSVYSYTFSDQIDGVSNIDQSNRDNILVHSIGLKFRLGSSKDKDRDGIPDQKDSCPNEPGSKETNGCPDDDGDTIINANDLCPSEAGDAVFRGCPDSDNDNIPDFEDACPMVSGLSAFNGCPDSDGDGVADPNDECPEIAGEKATNGCPDDDGDGFKNSIDECISLAGIEKFNGCPDSDNDGIIDPLDACPLLFGYRPNKGCPEIDPTVRRALDVIFENLIFASNSANIDATSLDDLDLLVTIMKEDLNLKLSIEGHTDNRGDRQYNLELSRLRAEAVKQHLVDGGISADRIQAIGYGQTRPIESNDTVKGRLKNRRVELKISYN